MSDHPAFSSLLNAAAAALKDKRDEINKLNVFPVPDGDTGTNMSLTMDAVLQEIAELPDHAGIAEMCTAITQGSLMGARGNSGVILSQILRGLCDEVAEASEVDTKLVAEALDRSRKVAFQAVRKPVEGTMLTVLKDSAAAAKKGVRTGMDMDALLPHVVNAAFESVRNTPNLLPVLKENGVVDAGGYGLAILAEGLVAAYEGHEVREMHIEPAPADLQMIVDPENDWDDQEYMYCTEFLLFGESLESDSIEEYISSAGGSELVVGSDTTLKIHVHTNDPGTVLAKMISYGEIGDVHIHNMRRQTRERSEALAAEGVTSGTAATGSKPYGFVTVAAGPGLKGILESLGADIVVNGGQTMNPSTAELLDAAKSTGADQVIIMPNNKNIIMAATQAAEMGEGRIHVVPTKAVPEAFAALLAFDPESEPKQNVDSMMEAASYVRTGEVTTAIKNSKAKVGDIRKGQVIGISNGEIEIVGEEVTEVAVNLAEHLADDAETLTILAGEQLDDSSLESLVETVQSAHPDVEVDAHRGDQPLYPVIIAAE